MFYSRQLLARKAPLGQIWMAATMRGKLNRKKLVKLNIIQICEEIMNPSVPMALRLSGILMGGVVIVYERKVKLLYDDVNRLLVELNQAWKVNSVPDPTLLPKAKSQAKYEAVTLPQNRDEDLGEPEQSLHYTETNTMMGFTHTAYFAMRLDNMDDPTDPQEELTQDYHQANTADITLNEIPDRTETNFNMFSHRFERFDIEGDENMHFNFEHTTNASTLIPSPTPPQEKPHEGDEILEQHPEDQAKENAAKAKEVLQKNHFRQGVNQRRARKQPALIMDDEQTVIPGHIFQSWLQDTSDITPRRKNKKQLTAMAKRKIADLMELPPTVLVDGLYTYGLKKLHYPTPLLELWRKSTQPLHDSYSGNTSPGQHPEPSAFASPPEGTHEQNPFQNALEDFHTGVDSPPVRVSIDKLRSNANSNNLQTEILLDQLRTNATNLTIQISDANLTTFTKNNPLATPRDSGDDVRSIPSSGSGHGFLSHNSDSSRSSKKRAISPFRNRSNGLEPVDEENSWQHPDPNFKLAKLYENEPMMETGPTQTQIHPHIGQPEDPLTHSIRLQLKTHFETPGTPKVESLNHLAFGLDKKRAASLFFQTCVLATQDSIRVQQKVPYGDILISKGSKM